MARKLNIIAGWWTDLRRYQLIEKLGSEQLADGCMVYLWRISQEHWADGRRLVPLFVLKNFEYLDAIIECDLAHIRNSLIYVKGTKQHHEWIAVYKESASKGGKSLRNTSKRIEKRITKRTPSESSANHEANREHTYTYTNTYTHTPTNTHTNTHEKEVYENVTLAEAKSTKKESDPINKEIWETYSKAYFEKYGVEPVRNAKVNAQISQLGKRLGKEAPAVARFYLSHPKSWYVQNSHNFDSLLKDCEGLRTQMLTGQKVTQQNAVAVERTHDNLSGWGKFLKPVLNEDGEQNV